MSPPACRRLFLEHAEKRKAASTSIDAALETFSRRPSIQPQEPGSRPCGRRTILVPRGSGKRRAAAARASGSCGVVHSVTTDSASEARRLQHERRLQESARYFPAAQRCAAPGASFRRLGLLLLFSGRPLRALLFLAAPLSTTFVRATFARFPTFCHFFCEVFSLSLLLKNPTSMPPACSRRCEISPKLRPEASSSRRSACPAAPLDRTANAAAGRSSGRDSQNSLRRRDFLSQSRFRTRRLHSIIFYSLPHRRPTAPSARLTAALRGPQQRLPHAIRPTAGQEKH